MDFRPLTHRNFAIGACAFAVLYGQTVSLPGMLQTLSGRANLTPLTGDPAATDGMSYQLLENLRQQQASSLADFDVFWVFAVVAVALIALVLLMRRSVAEQGAHLAAE